MRIHAFSSNSTIPSLCSNSCKILDQYGLEIEIPSPRNHETTSHVMISRGTNRFVDEVHDHKVELRSSTELLSVDSWEDRQEVWQGEARHQSTSERLDPLTEHAPDVPTRRVVQISRRRRQSRNIQGTVPTQMQFGDNRRGGARRQSRAVQGNSSWHDQVAESTTVSSCSRTRCQANTDAASLRDIRIGVVREASAMLSRCHLHDYGDGDVCHAGKFLWSQLEDRRTLSVKTSTSKTQHENSYMPETSRSSRIHDVHRTLHCTHAYAHILSCAPHTYVAQDCQCCACLKIFPSPAMSLLGVPSRSFPPILSSPTCSLTRLSASSTPLIGMKRPSCAPPQWSGMSGHLANPTPGTGYEPKFCIDVSNEHTSINLPDSNRNFPHDYCATIVATTEDLDVLRHSGASSTSNHSAAGSRDPTVSKPGSLGNSLTKVLPDYDSVDSRNIIRENCADLEKETVLSTLFWSESKGKRDRDQNVEQSLRDRENFRKILARKAELAVRGEKLAQHKLYEAKADVEVIGKREIRILLFLRSIRSSSPNDSSYNRRINRLIRPRETK